MTTTRKILIIQTASIGDVILATPLIESLAREFPVAQIDFLLKKGFENLLSNHPLIRHILTWDKTHSKFSHLARLIRLIRKEKYEMVINVQRFFSTGLITSLSGARVRSGFNKNPLSFLFTHKAVHVIGQSNVHEVDRNLMLIRDLVKSTERKLKLYPSEADFHAVKEYTGNPYVCIAPASLWFTKQLPEEKWIQLICRADQDITVLLMGSGRDHSLCERIRINSGRSNIRNLAGELTFLQSAALMKGARMNFVNDSAPMHLASSVNAPVTAVFCSTVTDFGFGPLSDDSMVVETHEKLSCRPCGLHGYRECPEKHFRCATTIDTNELINRF